MTATQTLEAPEVVELTLKHLHSDHPQLADKLTRDDIVALIEVVD